MNKLSLAGALVAIPAMAAVTLAASPNASPNASPTASPTASPSSSAAAPASAANQAQTWNAQVQPVAVAGNVSVTKQADGTGLITLQLTGMVDEAPWTVDVQAGTIEMPSERVRIALKTGDDVEKVAPDTIKVHLTKDEMSAFLKATQSKGVVLFVSDGTRLSAAVFPAA